MQRRDRTGGSPRDETCASIDSHGAAGNSSPSRVIRAVAGERCAGAIPPYLILGSRPGGTGAGAWHVAALQQVYSRISALSATANRPKTMLNWPMFVQIERRLPLSTEVQQNIHTVTGTGSVMCVHVCVCETQNAGTDPRIPTLWGGNFNKTPYNRHLDDIAGCKALKSDVR